MKKTETIRTMKAPMYGVECPLQNKTYIMPLKPCGVCPCCGELIGGWHGEVELKGHVIKFGLGHQVIQY